MSHRLVRFLRPLTLLALLSAATPASAEDKVREADAEKSARDALVKFDKNWKDYTNEPNLGDPRWKLKMETLVKLAKAGRAAIFLLEQAAKNDSAWAPHTRELASYFLAVSRDTPAIRDAWASYDVSLMDSAQQGKAAPDFSLADATGRNYRLGDCRGKNAVVLTFILQDR